MSTASLSSDEFAVFFFTKQNTSLSTVTEPSQAIGKVIDQALEVKNEYGLLATGTILPFNREGEPVDQWNQGILNLITSSTFSFADGPLLVGIGELGALVVNNHHQISLVDTVSKAALFLKEFIGDRRRQSPEVLLVCYQSSPSPSDVLTLLNSGPHVDHHLFAEMTSEVQIIFRNILE